MVTKALPGAEFVDLTQGPYNRGNGPFGNFLGVCLHVNVDESGTPLDFWKNNAGQVTPNFQVFKDGRVLQLLPFDWQPWCQVNGNFNYAAIETAGLPSEPLTAEQCISIAKILRTYHEQMGMILRVANSPGAHGFIIHSAGGMAWGGHSCPGTIRAGQRQHILDLAKQVGPPLKPGTKLRRDWPNYMSHGDYFGLESGPNQSRGGSFEYERPDIEAIQHRLHELGFYHGGDRVGYFHDDTAAAVVAWKKKVYPGDPHPHGKVFEVNWDKLFTY